MATIVVASLAGLFVYLGFWQLDRRQGRISENDLRASQLAEQTLPIAELLAGSPNVDLLEYRRVTVDGEWLVDQEVLIRSQVHLGTAGFHVITPYAYQGGTVLVNRGWVPITMDSVPVQEASPKDGPIEGWVHLSQKRGWLSPEDAPGHLVVFNRVDIDRIGQQVTPKLDDVYVVLIDEDDGQLASPLDLPEIGDEGPHLGYAIQWFGFAIVGVVGFFFLYRRKRTE